MTRNIEEIERICKRLLDNQIGPVAIEVSTLGEFQLFYNTLVHLKKEIPMVSLVNLETIVKVQFSNISPQHFDIISEKALTEDDFNFIKNKIWYGAKSSPKRFLPFLIEEVKYNRVKLFPILILGVILLYIVDNDSLYELSATLLIQSSTVFLSIYLIFTVAQNQIFHRDMTLFRSGILQQYYNDDRNVILLGILTIAATFLNIMLVFALTAHVSSSSIIYLQVIGRALKAVSTTIVITLLFNTFFIVADYYLDRTRDVVERDFTSEILHQDYKKYSGYEN